MMPDPTIMRTPAILVRRGARESPQRSGAGAEASLGRLRPLPDSLDEVNQLAGFVLAALVVILTAIERGFSRSEALRTTIYQRQLDAVAAVYDLIVRWFEAIGAWSLADPGSKEAVEAELQVVGLSQELTTIAVRYEPVLPRGTLDAIDEVLRRSDSLTEGLEDLDAFWDSITALNQQVRRDLGVDKLSDRIRQVTGVAGEDRLRAIRARARRANERLASLRRR
jgi:hypothetical protein